MDDGISDMESVGCGLDRHQPSSRQPFRDQVYPLR